MKPQGHSTIHRQGTPPMFIAMNRFKVLKDSASAFETVWLSRDSHLDRVPGFLRIPSAARAGTRRPRAVFVPHGLGEPGSLHGLDAIRAFPGGAQERRRQQAALPRAARVRGFRGHPDGRTSQRARGLTPRMRRLSQESAVDIGLREISSHEQQGAGIRLRRLVREAIAEIEPRRMNALAQRA